MRVENNKNRILRSLYHTDSELSRKEVQNRANVTKSEFYTAMNKVPEGYISTTSEEMHGGLNDRYKYSLTKQGEDYVENKIKTVPIDQKNTEEISSLKRETDELRSEIDELSNKLDILWDATEDNLRKLADKIKEIDKRVDRLAED